MKLAGFILIAVVHLTSCVGGGLVIGKKEEHSDFGINRTRSKPLRRVTPSENGSNPTRSEIRSKWGEPDRTDFEDGEELWSYQKGLAVRGAIPMIGIGIPLVTPIGRDRYGFYFPNGSQRARMLAVESNRLWGGYFGVSSFSDSKGFGFHRLGE